MISLRHLCCGISSSEGRLTTLLSILGGVIERYGEKALLLISEGADDDRAMYGSFVARKLLETTSSALLARMDPTRFLILQEYQMRAGDGYRSHERHAAAIAWAGDIIPDKACNSLWGTEASPDRFIRSLLGGHLAEVVWPSAIERFMESSTDLAQSQWLEELFRIYEAKNKPEVSAGGGSSRVGAEVLGVFRAKVNDMYSSLSKGVHLEFVIDETNILDPATVAENIRGTVKLATQLGYLSNHIDSMFTSVELTSAYELAVDIEQKFEQQS